MRAVGENLVCSITTASSPGELSKEHISDDSSLLSARLAWSVALCAVSDVSFSVQELDAAFLLLLLVTP